jgi:hypothetical protein
VRAAARDRLAALLGGATGTGAFSAGYTAAPGDLSLEVLGLGPIPVPVPPEVAEALATHGRPARFGLGEKTLHDPRVRDTAEIPKSRVKIDQRRWNRTLLPALDKLRDELGLPPGCRLTAELHTMLVYGPGQFFAPHQDSEKADDMIGTLVVTLPGVSRGGSLIVEHRGTTGTYRASAKQLSLVLFYGDCRHEVRPVTSGHRVVLTYNLILRGGAPAQIAPGQVDELALMLKEHFAEANRLVYLPAGRADASAGVREPEHHRDHRIARLLSCDDLAAPLRRSGDVLRPVLSGRRMPHLAVPRAGLIALLLLLPAGASGTAPDALAVQVGLQAIASAVARPAGHADGREPAPHHVPRSTTSPSDNARKRHCSSRSPHFGIGPSARISLRAFHFRTCRIAPLATT